MNGLTNGAKKRAVDVAAACGAVEVLKDLVKLGCDVEGFRFPCRRASGRTRGEGEEESGEEVGCRRKPAGRGVGRGRRQQERGSEAASPADLVKTSPLSLAAFKGHSSSVRLLLAPPGRASVDAASGEGMESPLMAAVGGARAKAVLILLRGGADLGRVSGSGECLRSGWREFLERARKKAEQGEQEGGGGRGEARTAAEVRKEAKKVKKLMLQCTEGWCRKSERVWTHRGLQVARLVLDGREATQTFHGRSLGAMCDDMRREIMGYLCREDFVVPAEARESADGGDRGDFEGNFKVRTNRAGGGEERREELLSVARSSSK